MPFILLTIYRIIRSPLSALEIRFELVEMFSPEKPTIDAITSSLDDLDHALLISPYPRSRSPNTEWPYHAHRKYAESFPPSDPLMSLEKALEMQNQFARFQRWHYGLDSSQMLTLPAAVPSVTVNHGIFLLLLTIQAINPNMYALPRMMGGHLTNQWALRNYCNTLLSDLLLPAIHHLSSAGPFSVDLEALCCESGWPLEALQALHTHLCLLDTTDFLDVISSIETTFYLLGITFHCPITDTSTSEISLPPRFPTPKPIPPPRLIPQPVAPRHPTPEPLSPPPTLPNPTPTPAPRDAPLLIAVPVGGLLHGKKPGKFGVSK